MKTAFHFASLQELYVDVLVVWFMLKMVLHATALELIQVS